MEAFKIGPLSNWADLEGTGWNIGAKASARVHFELMTNGPVVVYVGDVGGESGMPIGRGFGHLSFDFSVDDDVQVFVEREGDTTVFVKHGYRNPVYLPVGEEVFTNITPRPARNHAVERMQMLMQQNTERTAQQLTQLQQLADAQTQRIAELSSQASASAAPPSSGEQGGGDAC